MLIGYGRVSTSDQNTDLQVDALREAGCEKLFIETASGAKADRPKLEQALAYAREGDALVVWKLDRLGRSLKQIVTTVDELAGRGVGFRVLTMAAIDTTRPDGKLVFGIFASLAEFEREIIRERVNEGLAAARRRGRRGGRPRAIDDDKREMIEGALLEGRSVVEAATLVGVHHATIYNAINAGLIARPKRADRSMVRTRGS